MKKRFLLLTLLCTWVVSMHSQPQLANNQQELWIENGNRRIFGILSRPNNGTKKQPVAIIAHGFNGSHHFGMNYFPTLNLLGYQCYTFDFPSGSVNSRSDNNTMNMSVRQEQNDLQAIINYFKQQPDVDASRIVLIGESQGGLVSALTAAQHPKDIYKLILIYPAFCIPDNWNGRYPHAEEIPDTTRLWNVPLSRHFFMELRDMKPYEESTKYKKPVLIIHGDADPIVPISYAQRAVEAYKHAELHTIPQAGHGFKPEEWKLAAGWITEFLKKK